MFLDSWPLPAYFRLSRDALSSPIASPGPSISHLPPTLTFLPLPSSAFKGILWLHWAHQAIQDNLLCHQVIPFSTSVKLFLLSRVISSRDQDGNIFMGNYSACWVT